MISPWSFAGAALKPAQLREARRFTIQFVYQLEATQQNYLTDQVFQAFFQQNDVISELKPFIEAAARVVIDDREQIDSLIESCSSHWKLTRIARVDLAILRVCTAELMTRPEVTKDVIINEGVELGKQFGSTASGGFINGVLDGIAKVVESKRKSGS